jgi:hypothetical protein
MHPVQLRGGPLMVLLAAIRQCHQGVGVQQHYHPRSVEYMWARKKSKFLSVSAKPAASPNYQFSG